MKLRRISLSAVAILGAVALVAFLVATNQNEGAAAFAQKSPRPPTPAPTRTPGPPISMTPRPYPTLAQPLTEELALNRALEIDSHVAKWGKPWSLNTPSLETGRITIAWHSDRSYDGAQFPSNASEKGPVWSITIKGPVQLSLPGLQSSEYDGVTYIIAQNTGNFLGWRTGPAIIQASATPSAPMSQPPVASTVTALTGSSCTKNPSGLSFRVSQQPGVTSLPGASGPVHQFYVEGTGFVPGEKLTIVIKGRVAAPGTMGSTSETVRSDSTFATSIGAAVVQPNVPFDFYVLHRRGVACGAVTVEQAP